MFTSPVIGIIAEYNPFHNGHAYQIRHVKAQFPKAQIVTIMSGSFTQRGEPAVLDKWQRAELAVENGSDLVLELPYAFACRSAQHFATGGVRMLSALGCATHLAFGAETDHLATLSAIARAIDSPEIQAALHMGITDGLPYAAALTSALAASFPDCGNLMRQPNNILAIEYLRTIRQFAPGLQPLLIPRCGAGYHEQALSCRYASASGIRSELAHANPSTSRATTAPDWKALADVMPQNTLDMLKSIFPSRYPQQEFLYRALLARLHVIAECDLQDTADMREGLEHRLLRAVRIAASWQECLYHLGTRRYPFSSLSRILLHILMGFTKEEAEHCAACGPAYLRLLAVKAGSGTSLLHAAKRTAHLPILTKIGKYLNDKERRKPLKDLSPLQRMLCLDLRATELRELTLPQPDLSSRDYLESPRICTHHIEKTSELPIR